MDIYIRVRRPPRTRIPLVSETQYLKEVSLQEQQVALIKTEKRRVAVGRVNSVGSRIQNAGSSLCGAIASNDSGCYFPIEVMDTEELNAYADGEKIYITQPLVEYLSSDDDIAAILAHEYAHNMMGHPQGHSKRSDTGGDSWYCSRHCYCSCNRRSANRQLRLLRQPDWGWRVLAIERS